MGMKYRLHLLEQISCCSSSNVGRTDKEDAMVTKAEVGQKQVARDAAEPGHYAHRDRSIRLIRQWVVGATVGSNALGYHGE